MNTPSALDSTWHLRREISRLLAALDEHLALQRQRGRKPAADAVRGFVIEEGEAEGLLSELTAHWNLDLTQARQTPGYRSDATDEVTALAESVERQGVFPPLRHATRAFELTQIEYDALLLALAAELDARFGRLFAYLNDHVGHTRPTLVLALQLGAMHQ